MSQDLRNRLLQSDLQELIAPDLIADPYPAYEQLRGDPIRMRSGTALVTDYAAGAMVLRDDGFVRESMPKLPGRAMRTVAGMLITLNPPEHTRLRDAATPLVPPDTLEAVERYAYDFTTEALTAARPSGGMEVVSELATPLALTVISDLLAISDDDQASAQDWVTRLNQAIDTPVPLRATRAFDMIALLRHQQVGPRALLAMRRSTRHAERTIRDSNHHGMTGLIPSLQKMVANETITVQEAASIWLQVLLAGVDTVQTLLSTAISLFSAHPDQYDLLAGDRALLPGAIEEVLRFESPTRLFGRVVDRDVALSGLELQTGDDVVVIFGAANRDPHVFSEPHRFDITRERSRKHLAFGHGIHFCLGAQLARSEATGALTAILDQLDGAPPRTHSANWRPSYFMRSLERLHLQL